jgi:hypothetical protein
MNNWKLILCFFLWISGLHLGVHGQKTIHFEGWKDFNGTELLAEFEYYEKDGDTIFHGPFKLYQPVELTDESTYFNFSNIYGKYQRGKLNGNLELKKGRLKPVGGGVFKNYNYTFKVSGTESVIKMQFKDDKQLNSWKLYEWKINESEVSDTIFTAFIGYGLDSLNGLNIVNEAGDSISGKLNKDGFAEGRWQYFITSEKNEKILLKEWVFEDNMLVGKILYKNGTTQEIDMSQDYEGEKMIVTGHLSESYFDKINLVGNIKSGEQYALHKQSKGLDTLIVRTLNKLQENVGSMKYFSLTETTPQIKVRVKKFPLTPDEEKYLTSLKSRYHEIDTVISGILQDPQVNLAGLANERVQYFLTGLEVIRDVSLQPVRQILSLKEDNGIEYLDRNMITDQLLSIKQEVELIQTKLDSSITLRYSIMQDMETLQNLNGLEKVNTYTDLISSEIKAIQDTLEYFVFETRKEKRLVSLETVLFEKYENLKMQLEGSVKEELDEAAGFKVNQAIIKFLDQELSQYSKIENVEEKTTYIEPLIECFGNVERLINYLEYVPFNIATIQDAYTKQVFNPYTFTNMEETVKPTIYKAYKDILLPELFGQIQKLSCKNIQDQSKNFNNVFEGMIEILKRDTRREERRLRRVNEPKKITEILGLILSFN